MLQSGHQLYCSQKTGTTVHSVPGKVFLIGEYAVLAGLPAIVAAVSPRFFLRSSAQPVHLTPGSPAFQLAEWIERQRDVPLTFDFEDPHAGMGGFGASTAQFALIYLAFKARLDLSLDWKRVWRLYRELTATPLTSPSGADLVAQWRGGVTLFDPSNLDRSTDLSAKLNKIELLVFSAVDQPGRKVATHLHLNSLSSLSALTHDLKDPLLDAIVAIDQGDFRDLGRSMSRYAEVLSVHGLECEATRRDRAVLSTMPGVLGVKGAGALQADSVLVLMSHGSTQVAPVIEMAKRRGLRLVSRGLPRQLGAYSCQV